MDREKVVFDALMLAVSPICEIQFLCEKGTACVDAHTDNDIKLAGVGLGCVPSPLGGRKALGLHST